MAKAYYIGLDIAKDVFRYSWLTKRDASKAIVSRTGSNLILHLAPS